MELTTAVASDVTTEVNSFMSFLTNWKTSVDWKQIFYILLVNWFFKISMDMCYKVTSAPVTVVTLDLAASNQGDHQLLVTLVLSGFGDSGAGKIASGSLKLT